MNEANNWEEVAQLQELAQLNLELAAAELKRCEDEMGECLAHLRKALKASQQSHPEPRT